MMTLVQEALRVAVVATRAICKKEPNDTETMLKHMGKIAKMLDEALFEDGFGIGTLRATIDVKKVKVFDEISE